MCSVLSERVAVNRMQTSRKVAVLRKKTATCGLQEGNIYPRPHRHAPVLPLNVFVRKVSVTKQVHHPRSQKWKKPVMSNWGVWHCAEPLGPGENTTWQCEKRERKGSFWFLIHLYPVTDKGGGAGRWNEDFPWATWEVTPQCHSTDLERQGQTHTELRGWNWRMLNISDYKTIFLWK